MQMLKLKTMKIQAIQVHGRARNRRRRRRPPRILWFKDIIYFPMLQFRLTRTCARDTKPEVVLEPEMKPEVQPEVETEYMKLEFETGSELLN